MVYQDDEDLELFDPLVGPVEYFICLKYALESTNVSLPSPDQLQGKDSTSVITSLLCKCFTEYERQDLEKDVFKEILDLGNILHKWNDFIQEHFDEIDGPTVVKVLQQMNVTKDNKDAVRKKKNLYSIDVRFIFGINKYDPSIMDFGLYKRLEDWCTEYDNRCWRRDEYAKCASNQCPDTIGKIVERYKEMIKAKEISASGTGYNPHSFKSVQSGKEWGPGTVGFYMCVKKGIYSRDTLTQISGVKTSKEKAISYLYDEIVKDTVFSQLDEFKHFRKDRETYVMKLKNTIPNFLPGYRKNRNYTDLYECYSELHQKYLRAYTNFMNKAPGSCTNNTNKTPTPCTNIMNKTPGSYTNNMNKTPGSCTNIMNKTPGSFI